MLSNITKHYGGVLALDHASLTCLRGEVHGLVGENGAGKSTLVKIFTAAVRRDEGEITLEGKLLVLQRPADAIRVGIGLGLSGTISPARPRRCRKYFFPP